MGEISYTRADSDQLRAEMDKSTAQEAPGATIAFDPVRWQGGKSPAELRQRIVAFEAELLRYAQVEIPVEQWFSHGVYVRQITIPAGVILTGKIHKHPCMSIVLRGEMLVVTDEGPRRVVGPCVYESPAGVKRAGTAISDCVWLTVHPYDGPPLSAEAMAAIFTVDTFEQLETFQRQQLEHRA